MLQLHDKNKRKIAGLVNYENLCIESVLSTGYKTLSFSYPKNSKHYDEIIEEGFIRTKENEFVIKSRDICGDYTKFECILNLDELEGNIFDRFESVEQTITAALNLAIVGTGWTVKDNTLKKKRTVRCVNKSSLEIVQEIKRTYRVDIVFNTLSKQIEIYEHLGEDKGTYFIDSLNLTALQVQSDSYKFATRIIAEGKDGLTFSSINNGKNYVENYQYSRKVKTIYWKDERYTIKENLLEDAKAKLKEISKPFVSYNASILNLAELNPKYKSILDYSLGDTITLISKNNKVKDKQRIVKTIEYPQDHSRDTVELANAVLKFEDIQQENQETTDTVNNITTDNGTINGSTIDSITTKQIEDFKANVIQVTNLHALNADIDYLKVNKADMQDVNIVKAKIGTLETTKANITELNSVKANLEQAIISKASITDLNAVNGKIGILESKTASIDNLLAGNLTADNFKTNAITAGSAVIAEGAIGSSQISSLSVNKLEAGDITTSKHRIVSADGTIEIVGNQILINRNNVNRVVLGEYRKKDGTTEYGLLVRAKDGQTVMLDGNGVHNAGITDGAIDNNKVADNANISGNKLDINSVIREVNSHGTETIAGTRIQVGDRTLDVELSTQKNTITEHGKELSSQKATIQALDNAIKLKVDSQTFTQSTTTINNNINKAKEEAINSANSNTTNAINNIQIGGVNLLISNLAKTYPNNVGLGTENKRNDESISYVRILSDSKKHISVFGATIGEILKDKFILNQKYTISCEVRIPTEGYVGFYAGTPVNHVLANKWTKISYTFVGTSNNVRVVGFEYSGTQLDYRNLKLEEGEFATDYSLAPEDVKKYSDDVAKAKSDLAKTEAIANADGKITAEEQKRIVEAKKNLDIAIAKAEKAKADAINTASADATNKANNALNSAKAFVNTEINTVNTHLNKNTSEINILKEKIESKVSQTDIDKSISAIQIGGRNLIRNSNFKNGLNFFNINGTGKGSIELVEFQGRSCLKLTNIADYRISKYLGLVASGVKKGRNITVSADFYIEKGDTLCFDTSHGLGVEYLYFNFKEHNKWQRLSITSSKKTTDNGEIRFAVYGKNENPITIYISLIKIEEGTTATDWTPAPEDIDKSITDNIKIVTDKISTVESNLTQTKSSIEANVKDLKSKTESITTNVSNINRDLTNKINSNLDVAKNFATSKAIEALNSAKSYTNAEITTVNSKVHNLESGINILKDQIKSKVSQSDIEKSISAIQVGGRNYLTNSMINKTNFDYRIASIYFGNEKPKEGEEFTISIKGELGKGKRAFGVYNSGGNVSLVSLDKRDSNGIYRGTFNWIVAGTNNTHINIYTLDSSVVVDSTIEWVKLEKGNKVSSSWTPAPEDTDKAIADNIKVVDTKISDVSSSLEQTKNSITQSVNNLQSQTTTLNGKIVNAETRLNSVEAKITDTAIINTVRREFYSKGETDNMYSSKTEVTQLSNSLEWKISTLGAGNLIKNSSFEGGFDCWEKFRNPTLSTNTEFLPDRYGKMISIEGDGGIYQRFPTIVGEKYTVSFYAEANQLKPLATTIGIEGINLITLKFEPGWKRWSFTFTATSKEHTFIAYLGQYGKFYLGRVMVTQGSILQEYREGLGIYSNVAKFDTNGFTVESSSTNTRTITDSAGFRVQDKRTGENLLEANTKGVSARGGRFYVDGPNGNYTLMWGRDIVINGQRAIVGTHSHPEASLKANKMYLNYNNDFRNGVEIAGDLTNNTFPIPSLIGAIKGENGFRKLSDGFMIVWGKAVMPIKEGKVIEGTIPFHTKFPNACFLFNAKLAKVDGNDYWAGNYTLNSYPLDKFGGRVYGLNMQKYISTQGAWADVYYFAIGC